MNNKNMDSLMIIILALGILAGGLVLNETSSVKPFIREVLK